MKSTSPDRPRRTTPVNRAVVLLSVAAGLAVAPPAFSGDGPLGLGLLKRRQKEQKDKPPAANPATALITTLQSDPDEGKRKAAAAELRGIDPRSNAGVLPALIGSLQKDPSPAVRAEVAESIGKMKPVAQPAGIALETALQTDPDPKVREAISSALWQYHLNGYRTPPGAAAPRTAEPPLAASRPGVATVPAQRPGFAPPPAPGDLTFRPITNTVGKGVFYQPTVEPPLARPKPVPSTLPPPLPAAAVPDPATTPTPPPTSVPSTPLPAITIPPAPMPEKK